MERFAEIVKGRTYLHRPNQSLNLYLTATLAIAVAVVDGVLQVELVDRVAALQ